MEVDILLTQRLERSHIDGRICDVAMRAKGDGTLIGSIDRRTACWVPRFYPTFRLPRRRPDIPVYGISTLSMTWITPLLALISVAVTVALSIITLPFFTTIFALLPLTVLALLSLTTSDANTFPETT